MNLTVDTFALKAELSQFARCRIGVLGDYCIDAYWTLDEGEREVSIETGKPTYAVTAQRYSLGGAANIVANLAALGIGTIKAFAIVGNDIFGRELIAQLERIKVDCSGIIVQEPGWDTPVYSKPYLTDEELERIDFGRFNVMNQETEQQLIAHLEDAVPGLDILILNRQLSQGVCDGSVFSRLLRMAATDTHCRFLLDFRGLPEHFEHMIVKLNAFEAAAYFHEAPSPASAVDVDQVQRYAERIHAVSQQPVIITRGDRGLLIYDGKSHASAPGIQIMGEIDPVGAGDTALAALAACLAAGISPEMATNIANLASGVTVQKLRQTGTASPQEIIALSRDADYIHTPELAQDIRRACYLGDSQIEIVNSGIDRGRIIHAVFDHDGTISVLREGWESIMEPMMIRAILGDKYDTAPQREFQRVASRVRNYIDQSSGIQTILQMQALVEMVKDFGYVTASDTLDALAYKKVYNDALMNVVTQRRQRFERGELDVTDYTVKGAFDLLRALHQRGVVLYLASGTDEADVQAEAELLGYTELFEGRIFGALGDVSKYSKKMVIDHIIVENSLAGPQLLTIGDGPVEIRETKRCGGIAVGVASDEVRRFGLNEDKRTRLIHAGADVIIADFAQRSILLRYLFAED